MTVALALNTHQVKIRPFWDWNESKKENTSTRQKVKIRPFWDWNIDITLTGFDEIEVKIRPFWDWNVSDATVNIGYGELK